MKASLHRRFYRVSQSFAYFFVCLVFLVVRVPSQAQTNTQTVELFEKKVRPLLVDQCFSCHGSDVKTPMGGLRLNSRAALLKGGMHGAAIVVGNPESSLLIRAIKHSAGVAAMPPSGKLTTEQVGILSDWIRDGAVYPEAKKTNAKAANAFDLKARLNHWAWQPIKRTVPPAVKDTTWTKNPIDAFVRAKLDAKGFKPNPAADRRTLIRRITFDLTGLPPTPDEIHAFINDKSPIAYEKVIDRLLASPHYGERWSRHWMDLVRFSETDGHEFDFDKPGAFQYRDYLIRAFNADVPYNQFVTEHVAGDLLPTPRRNPKTGWNESLIGTAFWWFGEGKHSPVDLKVDEAERIDNQIDVFSKTFLGLGVACARCHDHKFDAISTKDYYALSGYLKSSRYHVADLLPPLTDSRKSELQRAMAAMQQNAAKFYAPQVPNLALPADFVLAPVSNETPETFRKRREERVSALRKHEVDAKAALAKTTIVADFALRDTFAKWSHTGDAFALSPTRGVHLRFDPEKGEKVTGVFGSGLAYSAALSDGLSGGLRSESFVLAKNNLWFRVAGRGSKINLVIDGFQRIQYPIYGGLKLDVNSADRFQWLSMNVSKWIGSRAYIEFLDKGAGYLAADKIVATDGIAPPDAPNPLLLAALDDAKLLNFDDYTSEMKSTLAQAALAWKNGTLAQVENSRPTADALDSLLPKLPAAQEIIALTAPIHEIAKQISAPVSVVAMTDGTAENDAVHLRGSVKLLGNVVPRRFLEGCRGTLTATPTEGSGRLNLALQMTDARNPLLARVIVNRLWHHHFGRGIVATPDDFGFLGERPSHPELLDYLASELVRQKWSLKKLHREILLSQTYRQSSKHADAKTEERDPLNLSLHRMPVQRLEAEAIRDSVLAVSGRLDQTLYGASVMPFLTEFMEGRGRPAKSGELDGLGRRSLYVSVRRNFLVPFFLAFDYPIPFSTIGRRTVSNVPAQALALMNNPLVMEMAKFWANSLVKSPLAPEQRIETMYETAFGRLPSVAEKQNALQFLTEQGKVYAASDPNDTRVWADLCHVLFNVKEFILIP